jgi:hypothetical protein
LSGETTSEFHIQSEDYTGATYADIVFDAGNGSGSYIERARIDSSGNLGLGISPTVQFDVVRDQNNATPMARFRNNDSGSGAYAGIGVNAFGNSWGFRMGSAAANSNRLEIVSDAFGTPIARVIVDTSGNLGLGVTPSAWGSLVALDISSYGSVFGFSNQTGLTGNCYYNGSSWVYKATAAATQYQQISGQHIWYNAASGSGTFNFTQAMTLDASGNLGIGATSPDTKLHISGSDVGAGSGEVAIKLSVPANLISAQNEIRSGVTSGTNPYISFAVRETASPFAIVERLRITSAGNLGLGATAPVSLLEVQGGLTTTGAVVTLSSKETSTVANDVLGRVNFRAALDGAGGDAILTGASIVALAEGTFSSTSNATSLLFQTGSSEAATTKMTLTSAGNVGIGTSSPNASAILDVQSTTKGVRMPNMTTTEKNAISSPAAGLMVYDTTLAKLCVYTTAWETITSL